LTVVVPTRATFAPPTVTVAGMTATANAKFMPTFAGGGALSAASFAPRVNFANPSGPTHTVIADLDGDGKPDMAIADSYSHDLSLYRNISTAGSLTASSFAPRVVIPTLTGAESPYDLVAADVDGDGKLDLLMANRGNNIVSILRNISTPGSLGTNSFAPSVDLPVSNLPLSVAVRDVDRDGRVDLVVANFTSGNIAVLRNLAGPGPLSTASFAPPVYFAAGAGTHWVAVDDLDGDGKPDLAAVNANANSMSILRNTSTPGTINSNSFAAQFTLPTPAYAPCVKTADMDGDGKLDLLVATVHGNALSVYRNTASSGTLTPNSFTARVDFALGGRGHTLSLGDLNGDGKLDVVVDTEISSSLAVFQNQSTPGSFTSNSLAPRVNLATGVNAWGSSVGDLDGDGRPDILFCNAGDNTISIYRNLGPLPPTLTQQPASRTAYLGDPVTFAVTATGTAPFRYQWRRNGDPIAGATNSSLVLPEVQLSQAGNYSVNVSNLVGNVTSSNATLNVLVPTCTEPPSGLVAWWQAENTALDSLGQNHASQVGAAYFSSGKAGQGFEFKGYTNYIKIPASATLNVGTDAGFTVEGWIYPRNVAAFHPIWEWNTGVQGGNIGAHFWIGQLPSSYGLLFANIVATDGTSHTLSSANGVLASNAWQHVALTYDKASGVGRILLNGQIVAQGNLGTFTPRTDMDAFIGRRLLDYPGDWTYNSWFNGVVDEFSLYNRGLGTNEIAAIYAARGAGKCPIAPTVVSVTPPGWYVNEGQTVSFSALAVGSPPLTYQWKFGADDISGATSASLVLSNVVFAQAGNYSVVVTGPGGSTTSSNVTLAVNRAPLANAGATEKLLISPNGSNVVAVLDGSLSSDPDGNPLTYAWFRTGETNAFETGVVAVTTLPVGSNLLTLVVNDGMATGGQDFAVEVITTADAVDRLMALVQSGAGNPQPLLASLRAALASIDRSQPETAINQLEAFKNKVQAQIAPSDPALAAQLIADAQAIIDALNGGGSPAPAVVLEITSVTPNPNGKPHLKIRGAAGRVHIVEASTDMMNWVKVGIAGCCGGSDYQFDDAQSPDSGVRFYRVVSPK
jgi:hypothetical protein